MNSKAENLSIYKSVNELVEALCGESLDFDTVIRSVDLPLDKLEQYSSWSADSYTRNCIIDCEKFELILLCWEHKQFTPIHDHGGEECWVRIVKGNFKETIYQMDDKGDLKKIKTTESAAGDISYMKDFMGFHSLENLDDSRSMSLHLYAKPIRNCQLFDEEAGEFVKKELVYDTVSEDAAILNF